MLIGQRNRSNVAMLLKALDDSRLFYDVAPANRSIINVPFFLRDDSLQDSAGLDDLTGRRSWGAFAPVSKMQCQ